MARLLNAGEIQCSALRSNVVIVQSNKLDVGSVKIESYDDRVASLLQDVVRYERWIGVGAVVVNDQKILR